MEFIALNIPRERHDYSIRCPNCKVSFDDLIRQYIPPKAIEATISCYTTNCGTLLDLKPNRFFGWARPRIVSRARV